MVNCLTFVIIQCFMIFLSKDLIAFDIENVMKIVIELISLLNHYVLIVTLIIISTKINDNKNKNSLYLLE